MPTYLLGVLNKTGRVWNPPLRIDIEARWGLQPHRLRFMCATMPAKLVG